MRYLISTSAVPQLYSLWYIVFGANSEDKFCAGHSEISNCLYQLCSGNLCGNTHTKLEWTFPFVVQSGINYCTNNWRFL